MYNSPDNFWEDADKFDQWVRNNVGPLRQHVADVKDKYPKARDVKGIVIISTKYRRTGGAPVL